MTKPPSWLSEPPFPGFRRGWIGGAAVSCGVSFQGADVAALRHSDGSAPGPRQPSLTGNVTHGI